jgi:hypothetical protein
MSLTATATAAAGIALVRRVVDDVYANAKAAAIGHYWKRRTDVNDQQVFKAIWSCTSIKTLWSIEREVSLYSFYYPSHIIFSEGVKKAVDKLADFGPAARNFVIEGTAGQGKSIFMRFLCGQELTQGTGRLPLFMELRRISPSMTLSNLISESLQRFKIPVHDIILSALAGSGRVVLLLDAFDEIDPSLSERTIGEIELLSDTYPDTLQILVTARPNSDIQRSSRFRVVKLAKLEKKDHLPFLQKICEKAEQAEALQKAIERSASDVQGLLTTPLMMTILVTVFKAMHTVPETVPKFYEELFDTLFYRHDQSKPGFRRKRHTQLEDSKFKLLFSAFCFFVRLEAAGGVLTNQQVEDFVRTGSRHTNIEVEPSKFRDEVIKTLCLMHQDGIELAFVHKSVAQYYASSFVRASGDDFAAKFYSLAKKNPTQWDLELKFLAQTDTYRFMKWKELPFTELASNLLHIDLAGKCDNSDAATALFELMVKSIRISFSQKDGVVTGVALHYPQDGDQATIEVLNEFFAPWGQSIVLKLHKSVCKTPHVASTSLLIDYVDVIREEAMTASRRIVAELCERHSAASTVIALESEKAAMLAGLLDRPPTQSVIA